MGKWMNKRVGFLVMYTGVFAVLALVAFSPFIIEGNSFVWKYDGFTQHVKALTFYGEYLREVAQSLVSGKGLPAFSFALGYGQDVLDSLNYYVVGDPLNVLAVFVPAESMPVLYTALVIVRFYLSGLAFSLYASYVTQAPPAGKLAGALTYVFCGFALIAGVRHPYFMNPLIYLPLVLFGVEKVLRERSHVPFALSIALCAVSNFYFFYMTFLIMALYIVMRLVAIHRCEGMRVGLKRAAVDFGHLVGAGVIGVLLSCVVFLPVVLFFLQDTRAAVDHVVPLLYSVEYYSLIPINLSATASPGMWTHLAVGIVGVVAIVSLFSERHANKQLKVALCVMFAMLLVPFVGHVFNGFSYVSNRWCWAFSFACALALAVRWDAIMAMSRKQAVTLGGVVGAYLVVSVVLGWTQLSHVRLLVVAVLWAVSVAAIAVTSVSNNHRRTSGSARLACTTVLVVVCAGIGFNALVLYSSFGSNYGSDFLSWEDTGEMFETEADYVARLASSDDGAGAEGEFYRYTAPHDIMTRNVGAIEGVSSTTSYWSLAHSHTKEFFAEMGIIGSDSGGCSWFNVDGMSLLAELVGVRYYAAGPDDLPLFRYKDAPAAQGRYFDPRSGADRQFVVYENESPLPFGFTYARTIAHDDFDALEPRERREAVLQAAVMGERSGEGDKAGGGAAASARESEGAGASASFGNLAVSSENLEFSSKVILYKLKAGRGVDLSDGKIVVSKKNATVTLQVDEPVPDACEPSIQFTDLVLDPSLEAVNIDAMFVFEDGTSHSVPVSVATALKNTYEPYRWITESPGYSRSRLTEVTLTFPSKGTYAYGDIQLIAQPMAGFEERVEALTQDVLEDVDMNYAGIGATLSTSRVTGHISLDEPKVLCTQIPYSDGWSVRVDGEPAELLQVGVLLSGVALGPGEHTVEFAYETPGLAAGTALSLAGIVLLVLTLALERRQRTRASNQVSDTPRASNQVSDTE